MDQAAFDGRHTDEDSCERGHKVVVIELANYDEGALSRLFSLRVSTASAKKNIVGERTRTADLLITSEMRGVSMPCRGLQYPHA